MQIVNLSSVEKLVLLAAIKSSNGSLLSLRKETGLGVDIFVVAINNLEQRKLLSRDIGRYKILPSALKWLATSQSPSGRGSKEDYAKAISAPQLSVTEFFIPNKEVFLKDLKKIG